MAKTVKKPVLAVLADARCHQRVVRTELSKLKDRARGKQAFLQALRRSGY